MQRKGNFTRSGSGGNTTRTRVASSHSCAAWCSLKLIRLSALPETSGAFRHSAGVHYFSPKGNRVLDVVELMNRNLYMLLQTSAADRTKTVECNENPSTPSTVPHVSGVHRGAWLSCTFSERTLAHWILGFSGCTSCPEVGGVWRCCSTHCF